MWEKVGHDPAGITDLPPEVIAHIMSYLSLADSISASLTCKRWYYEDSLLWKRHAARVVHVRRSRTIEVLCPDQEVLADWQPPPLKNFHFKDFVKINSDGFMSKFWQIYGPQIEELSIVKCQISSSTLDNILTKCPSLKSLKVDNSYYILGLPYHDKPFYSKTFLEGKDSVRLENLCELEVVGTSISIANLNKLVSVAPKLSSLKIDCPMELGTHQSCEFPCNCETTMPFLKPDEPHPHFPEQYSICRILTNLKLEKLDIELSGPIVAENLQKICQSGSLKTLVLRGCISVMGLSMKTIADACEETLQELAVLDREMYLPGEHVVSKHLSRLKQLRRLNFDTHDFCFFNKDGIKSILALKDLTQLEQLEISNFDHNDLPVMCEVLGDMKRLKHLYLMKFSKGNRQIEEKKLFDLAKALPPLETLGLIDFVPLDAHSFEYLVAAFVCTQQKTLKSLKLNNCPFLKGFGISGLMSEDITKALKDEEGGADTTQSKKLFEELKGISKYKSALLHLDLSNCKGLSERGLESAFKVHTQLQSLNLQRSATDPILKVVSTHCQQLENLDVSGTREITDIGVGHLSNLCKLRRLNLDQHHACFRKLTDASLEALIESNLSSLRWVNFHREFHSEFSEEAIAKLDKWLDRFTF